MAFRNKKSRIYTVCGVLQTPSYGKIERRDIYGKDFKEHIMDFGRIIGGFNYIRPACGAVSDHQPWRGSSSAYCHSGTGGVRQSEKGG